MVCSWKTGRCLKVDQWCKSGPISWSHAAGTLCSPWDLWGDRGGVWRLHSWEGQSRAMPSLGWTDWVGSQGPLSQITPCCFVLGVSCYSAKSSSETRTAETIWESKYFLITVSSKLLFAVNGRKWEKHVVAITQHRLYCWKRDLVHTLL